MKFLILLLLLSGWGFSQEVDPFAPDKIVSTDWPKRIAPSDSHLRRFKEPTLKGAPPPDSIDVRFIWVPTFNRPFSIRVTGIGQKATLTVVRLKGKGGYNWGEFETERNIDLSTEQWKSLLALVTVDGAREPSQKTSKAFREDFVEALSAMDGSVWYLEVRDQIGYTVEGVPNPIFADRKKELRDEANLNLKPFLAVCLKLFDLSGLDEKPDY